jgi:hypothetical protein
MYGKKSELKFTVQFSQADPAHLRVADILNRQGRFGKADYIVNAVLNYIGEDTGEAQRPAVIDERHIEAVVNKILRDRERKSRRHTACQYFCRSFLCRSD